MPQPNDGQGTVYNWKPGWHYLELCSSNPEFGDWGRDVRVFKMLDCDTA